MLYCARAPNSRWAGSPPAPPQSCKGQLSQVFALHLTLFQQTVAKAESAVTRSNSVSSVHEQIPQRLSPIQRGLGLWVSVTRWGGIGNDRILLKCFNLSIRSSEYNEKASFHVVFMLCQVIKTFCSKLKRLQEVSLWHICLELDTSLLQYSAELSYLPYCCSNFRLFLIVRALNPHLSGVLSLETLPRKLGLKGRLFKNVWVKSRLILKTVNKMICLVCWLS